ncbi:hypothetical protein CFIMG_005071RA [Ceratocystis fimbriata CBS 114723]|uniref:Nephrocystin 3-like N-terminal domain-containing protein n=1 Tax=Ceratocystis fimbriata CBS 114723 TaxID=1035309 RepID=A0A2C5X4Q0_9PEZI|nr:hypothetical protein CFIMG_005071RA [Ceratocystis fimbriata CBS 114723]
MEVAGLVIGAVSLAKACIDNANIVISYAHLRGDLETHVVSLMGYRSTLSCLEADLDSCALKCTEERTSALIILARVNILLSQCHKETMIYDLRKGDLYGIIQKMRGVDAKATRLLDEYDRETYSFENFFSKVKWPINCEYLQKKVSEIGTLFDILQNVLSDMTKKSETMVKTCEWITTINPQITHEKKRTEARLKEGNEKPDDGDRVAGEWLLASPCFNDWLSRQDNRLWYRGSVRKYTAEKEYQFAYFYILYTEKYTVYDVLASLCVQMLQHMEPLPSCVTNLWKRRNHGRETPSPSDIKKLYKQLLQGKDTFIVVDALDEFEESRQQELINSLQPEVTGGNLKLLVTSRDVPDFEDKSEGFRDVKVKANDHDLLAFIDQELNNDENKRIRKFIRKDPSLANDIKSRIKERADGVFVVAYLQMQWIMEQRSPAAIRDCLKKLPNSIDGMYKISFGRIEEKQHDEQRVDCEGIGLLFIGWLFYNTMSPHVISEEIAQAFISVMNDSAPSKDDCPLSVNEILASACSLLKYEDENTSRDGRPRLDFFHKSCFDYVKKKETDLLQGKADEIVAIFDKTIENEDLSLLGDTKFLEKMTTYYRLRQPPDEPTKELKKSLEDLKSQKIFGLVEHILSTKSFSDKKCVYMRQYDHSHDIQEWQDFSNPLYSRYSALRLIWNFQNVKKNTPLPSLDAAHRQILFLKDTFPPTELFLFKQERVYVGSQAGTPRLDSRTLKPFSELDKDLTPEPPLDVQELVFLLSLNQPMKFEEDPPIHLKRPFNKRLYHLFQTKPMRVLEVLESLDQLLPMADDAPLEFSIKLNSSIGLYALIFGIWSPSSTSQDVWPFLKKLTKASYVYDDGIKEVDLFNFLQDCYQGKPTSGYANLEKIKPVGYLTRDLQSFEIGDMAELLREAHKVFTS